MTIDGQKGTIQIDLSKSPAAATYLIYVVTKSGSQISSNKFSYNISCGK